MSNFNQTLEKLLKQHLDFIDNEGDLYKAKVIDSAWKVDPKLIELLLENREIKAKFFTEIKGHWVFNVALFVAYIQDKNFLSDSWTNFKNKIGLMDGNKFLNQKNDVALVWPFKDCILEGGQTDEESKRKEIFFNEILAQDEIDVLLDPKVLTNFRRYGDENEKLKVKSENLDGEEIPLLRGGTAGDGVDSFFTRDQNGTIKDNLIIKGNNLLALHTLKTQFSGKVKLIYIDPPYNTGNDGFRYNDNFNHSTWLTFMKNRLEVARELLRDDGVIFVQCDDNEQAYLKVLMDEIFGRENFVSSFIRKTGISARIDAKFISKEHDYIICFSKKILSLKLNKEAVANLDSYNLQDEYIEKRGKFKLNKLDRGSISYSKSLDYPINAPDGTLIYPGGKSESNGWCWRWSKDKLDWGLKNGFIEFKKNGGWSVYFKQYQFVDNQDKTIERENPYKSLMIEDFNNEIGTAEMTEMFGNKIFVYPKPEGLIKRIIEMSTEVGDIVLDYHLGSGTTAAVAHKMGRQYIGIEQMDYIETIAVERLKKVIGKSTPPSKDGTPQEGNFRQLTGKEKQQLQVILAKLESVGNSLM
jgi:adenine-specific DNA-methyltransferase